VSLLASATSQGPMTYASSSRPKLPHARTLQKTLQVISHRLYTLLVMYLCQPLCHKVENWVFQPAASWPNDGGDKIGSINLLVLTVAQISPSFLLNRLNNLLVPCLSIFHVFFSPVNMNVSLWPMDAESESVCVVKFNG